MNHLYANMGWLKGKSKDKWAFNVIVCTVLDGPYKLIEIHNNYHNSIENVEGFLLIKVMVNGGL